MNFLADVYVECDCCRGARYNEETLAVKYKGKSIADVLNMTVEEAYRFFVNVPKISRKLEFLYIRQQAGHTSTFRALSEHTYSASPD